MNILTYKRKLSAILFYLQIILFGTSIVWASDGSNQKISTIVIDPGHGGKDPGALGKIAKEKDIVLSIGFKLGELINKHYQDIEVIYTRDSDIFVPLFKRAEIANKNKADLFISIHANATKNTRVKGSETFAMGLHKSDNNLEVAKRENAAILLEENYEERYEGFNPKSAESYIIFSLLQNTYLDQSLNFASYVQDKFKQEAQRYNRGVKQAGFLVLWKTSMPSVLIETGFISNPQEEKYLISEQGQNDIALSIFNAFTNYKKAIESKSQFVKNPDLLEYQGISSESEIDTNQIVYRVQILASNKQLPNDSDAFKGLKDVYELKSGDVYKYAVGSEADYKKILEVRENVIKQFPGAFIIAIRNGARISVDEALKITKN
jgi:N-acetylmuramoyl-L-alanine amidase